jgi:two-component system response regulator YesN
MRSIMLVDDEELSRYAIRMVMEQNFTDVEIVGEAETGIQAVELYRKFRPDGVIMDITLPVMNGLEASRQILEEFPFAKIIICSAYDSFSFVSEALDLGVKSYILKPINRQEAVEKITKFFGSDTSKCMQDACARKDWERHKKIMKIRENLLYALRTSDHMYVNNMLNDFIREIFFEDYDNAVSQSLQLVSLMCCQIEKFGFSMDENNVLFLVENTCKADENLDDKIRFIKLENSLRKVTENILNQMDIFVSKNKSIVKKIKKHINYTNIGKVSLESLADHMKISPQYLSRIFKEEMGINFIEFITQERLELACNLLQSTSLSIKEIAFQCGYNDINYFDKIFKKHVGTTPANYKSGVRNI